MSKSSFTKCTTVGELKKAIAELPDEMLVGKWDGCESMMYMWVDGSTTSVYKDSVGFNTIYGGHDGESGTEMLVI